MSFAVRGGTVYDIRDPLHPAEIVLKGKARERPFFRLR
jgi:hypothetical protein